MWYSGAVVWPVADPVPRIAKYTAQITSMSTPILLIIRLTFICRPLSLNVAKKPNGSRNGETGRRALLARMD